MAGARVDGQSGKPTGGLVQEFIGPRLRFVHGTGGDDELAGVDGLLTCHCSAQQPGKTLVADSRADDGEGVDALGQIRVDRLAHFFSGRGQIEDVIIQLVGRPEVSAEQGNASFSSSERPACIAPTRHATESITAVLPWIASR